MNYEGPLYAPWDKVVKGRGFDPMNSFSYDELKYLELILFKTKDTESTPAGVSHDKLLQKVQNKIYKLQM